MKLSLFIGQQMVCESRIAGTAEQMAMQWDFPYRISWDTKNKVFNCHYNAIAIQILAIVVKRNSTN